MSELCQPSLLNRRPINPHPRSSVAWVLFEESLCPEEWQLELLHDRLAGNGLGYGIKPMPPLRRVVHSEAAE